MRNIITYLSLLLALLSCQKHDIVSQDPIQVSAYTGRILSKSASSDPDFRLAAKYDGDFYITTTQMTKVGELWKSTSRNYFWPYDISSSTPMQFFGVYSVDNESAIPARFFSSGTLQIVNLTGTEDLCAAYSLVETKPEGGILQLQFKHILASMAFTVRSDDANMTYALTGMTIKSSSKGTFDIENGQWTIDSQDSKNYSVTTFPTVTTTASSQFGNLLLLPQSELQLTVEYTITDQAGYTVSYTGDRAKSVTFDNSTRQACQTQYNLTLSSDRISFETVFTPWETPDAVSTTLPRLESDNENWN